MHKGSVITDAVHKAGNRRLLAHVAYTSLWAQVLDSYPFADIKKSWYALLRERARAKKNWQTKTEMLETVHTVLGLARQNTARRKQGWQATGVYPLSLEAMLTSVAKFWEEPHEDSDVAPVVLPLPTPACPSVNQLPSRATYARPPLP